jgi:hypothetical protein
MKTLFALVTFLAAVTTAPLVAQARKFVVPGIRGVPPTELIDTMGTPREIPFTPIKVFAALEKVYAEMKVKPEVHAAPFQIGNQSFYARGSLAKRRMSAWVECGSGMTGPIADDYKVYLGLVTFVEVTAGNTSIVRSVLVGNAINVTEGRLPTQRCKTTGELELMIHEMMVKELTKIE